MSAMGDFRFAEVLSGPCSLSKPIDLIQTFTRASIAKTLSGKRSKPGSINLSLLASTRTVPANDYVFLTNWRIKGSAEDVYEILTDIPGYLRWWPDVYLAATPLTPGLSANSPPERGAFATWASLIQARAVVM